MSAAVACYLRVSTSRQTVEHQRPQLERAAAELGGAVDWYEEKASGRGKRPVLDGLWRGVLSGRYQTLIIWRVDRLGRRAAEMLRRFDELEQLGVKLVVTSQPWFTSEGHLRHIARACLATFAEMEAESTSERTDAGMATARKLGRKIGRPSALDPTPRRRDEEEGGEARAAKRRDRAARLRAALVELASGAPLKPTARGHGLAVSTLRRARRAAQASA